MKDSRHLGHPYGLHRVREPQGVLPQPAWKIDADPSIYENELCIEVERLNIDSASFTQLKEEAQGDIIRIKEKIWNIIQERGKMHNPVTGSGGMLIGRVASIGSHYPNHEIQVGMKIATLVSLTLTPLSLEAIHQVDLQTGQVEVSGKAILFATAPYAILPDDLPERVTLAALDVCGAPLQTKRLVKPNQRVLVMGAGGKSGLLCLYQAWKEAGKEGQVIALEANEQACREIQNLNIAHEVIQVDATNPIAVHEVVDRVTHGKLADLTINCVNVPNTELSAILATRDQGLIYFFSMAVQFTAAALGAEGVGKDVQMMIGNGYGQGHAELTLNIFRESPKIKELFVSRYASR
ncbi:L-erythro-3,5-diaminohexanoate dehydrogenase [Thermoflavimicrobium daqui]|uniref:L-erythro-3,5-diaminohexanoate dehydrogenase n=1 Tax=Thermoflavimicrobium daqui TaxID=2137476 RepID=A0A364K3E3_9BACL|nr:L-erythro-3,5-diaminohexanoate dehydrogenase [Thermoflavimicrobium daqui]RAL23365.1 L-erythro-3,5-diaminohexanoate dehydrogenase [Thermoflavimicrobium daqui]